MLFKRVTIVGLGLIGGSIGMAIRRKRIAREVVGLSRSQSTVRKAMRRKAIHSGTTSAQKAVDGSDLVIIASPVDNVIPAVKRLLKSIESDTLVTDVASTKSRIVSSLDKVRGLRFVGSHPIAGSEKRGIESALSSLFDGAMSIVTPTRLSDPKAVLSIKRFWKALGTRVIDMSPEAHDRLLSSMSHLPHFVAVVLALSGNDKLPKTPQSFLDMTRIAEGDPDLWDDIMISNRANLLKSIKEFDTNLKALQKSLTSSNRYALLRLLTRAKSKRVSIAKRS